MSLTKRFLVATVFSVLLGSLFVSPLFAQTDQTNVGQGTMGISRMIDVKGKNVKDGDIISSTDHGAILSATPYDPQVLGIVSENAGIEFVSDDITNGVPVVSQGRVYVLVSSQQGNIRTGDLLTTSNIPGVAVKATKDGYVLGTALEDYASRDPKQTDEIGIELNLHYFNAKPTLLGSLTDILKFALLSTKDSPAPIFKYIVAAAVVIASFVLAFMTFGRTAAKGVEALGRNPAASKIINLGIVLNVAIVVVIVLAGLFVAFLILRL